MKFILCVYLAVFVSVLSVLDSVKADGKVCQSAMEACIPEEFKALVIGSVQGLNPARALKLITQIMRTLCSEKGGVKTMVTTLECFVKTTRSRVCTGGTPNPMPLKMEEEYFNGKLTDAFSFGCKNMDALLSADVCLQKATPDRMVKCAADELKLIVEDMKGKDTSDKDVVLQITCRGLYTRIGCISSVNFPDCKSGNLSKEREFIRKIIPEECDPWSAATSIKSLNIVALILLALSAKYFM